MFSVTYTQEKDRRIYYSEGNIYTYAANTDRSLGFEISHGIDIANSRKVRDLIKVFQNRYRVLGNYYYPPGTSILAHLVNPCFTKFTY